MMGKVGISLALLGLPSLGWADTRRFALIAAANDGGADRIPLRYAVTDAQAFAGVLEELGGVARANQTLLIEPDDTVMAEAIGNLAKTVAVAEARGLRTEVLVYYSGHSDEEGLLLGETRFAYSRLRSALEGIDADVRVVVLDSCASGAMVRGKGGVRRAAFLEDESVDVTGYAYLTSSSEDEAAQESDAIEASFFTHYLVSGLRGGADSTQDGRVTLNEAYQYAFDQTLKRTERTSIGAQHAKFDIQLAGSGDFVMTDLSQTDASLIFDGGIAGQVFVRDRDNHLVAELDKPGERTVELGLQPGMYSLVVDHGGDNRSEAVFQIRAEEHILASDLQFDSFDAELAVARGDAEVVALPGDSREAPSPPDHPEVAELPNPAPPAPRQPQDRSFSFGAVPEAGHTGAQIGIIGTEAQTVDVVQLALLFNQAETVQWGQFALLFNRAGTARGFQASLAANVATERAAAVQWATGLNLALGRVDGLQAAMINVAGDMRGVQFGLINQSRASRSVQFGLVNSGGSGSGVQFGLVNIANDYDGAAIGLVNVHAKGYNHVYVNGGNIEPVSVGVSYGSRYVYTSLQGGVRLDGAPGVAGGLGVHVPVNKVYGDLDVGAGWRFGGDGNSLEYGGFGRARLQLGYTFHRHFSVQTGPMADLRWGDTSVSDPLGTRVETGFEVDPGWTLGLRF